MKKIMTILFSLVYLISFGQGDVISAQDAARLMKGNKNLRIIDASKSKIYKAAHLKNAINISVSELVNSDEITGLLKSPAALAKLFASKGISEKNEILVYDEGSQKYSCRTYWVLKYLGALDVKILHKDNASWRKARLLQTSQVPVVKKTVFTPSLNKAIYASMEETERAIKDPGVIIVDARPPEQYNGSSSENPTDGHIPSAVNLYFKDLLTSTNAFKSKEQIQQIVKQKGIMPEKTVIVYCNTGIFASVVYVALTQILEYRNVKVYEGSYEEWWANYKPLVK
jgi:thiosulfate/3-mercaptopyruvate sulfurtransferase